MLQFDIGSQLEDMSEWYTYSHVVSGVEVRHLMVLTLSYRHKSIVTG